MFAAVYGKTDAVAASGNGVSACIFTLPIGGGLSVSLRSFDNDASPDVITIRSFDEDASLAAFSFRSFDEDALLDAVSFRSLDDDASLDTICKLF